MEPNLGGHEAIDHSESHVHCWRVSQLKRFGIPGPLAEVHADRLDWHQIARLVRRGCRSSPSALPADAVRGSTLE